MADEKKCPACSQWTPWTKSVQDICQHCGRLLTVPAINEGETPTASRFTVSKPSWLEIRPDDGVAMRAARRTAFAAHLIYVGIMWLFMMVFAALVH